jgi:hypothetical protein
MSSKAKPTGIDPRPTYHVGITLFVETEMKGNSPQEVEAMLRHKLRTFAALNPDLLVREGKQKADGSYDLRDLP